MDVTMEKVMLPEYEGFALLDKYGIPVPEHYTARTEKDAADFAERIGFPVVMKVISPQVVHKSDAGGVITGIETREQVYSSFRRIEHNVGLSSPDAVIEGVIVEKQYRKGLELILGGRTDPSFGKVITFGIGGTLVELIRDVAIRILPVTQEEIRTMVHEIHAYPLIRGYRNSPPLDEEELVRIIVAVCRFFEEEQTVCEFDFNPLILYDKGGVVVDARVYAGDEVPVYTKDPGTPMDASLLSPSSIAVIGASRDPGKVGYAVLRNLLAFPGPLYPVNPGVKEIFGKKVYPSVLDIPGSIDAAVIAIPARGVPGVLEEVGKKGVKLAIILSSGFREIGDEGARLEKELLLIAEKSGIRIVGPNCLGIIFPHRKINTTFDPISPRPGHIGFISQSGAIITTIVDWSLPEEIGFSAVISVGNQADLGFIDYIRYAANDETTKAIILYIEEIKNGKEFMRLMKDVTRKKPVIALKSGASSLGVKAASSHTGSLAGSYAVYQAAFEQTGIIPVYSIKEAFNVAELLASEGYPRGNRAVIITAAGGFAVLAADYAEKYGINIIPLPQGMLEELNDFLPALWSHENPLDIIGDGGAERYAKVFDVMIRNQDEWDIAIIIAVPSAVLDATHLAQEIARFSKHTHTMIVGCLLGGDTMKSGIRVLRENKIPNYSDIDEAFRAVGRGIHSSLVSKTELRR
jgi:acetyl coenzyme A synthetase (ADP forming)-like protein